MAIEQVYPLLIEQLLNFLCCRLYFDYEMKIHLVSNIQLFVQEVKYLSLKMVYAKV
jgi:hypothetical protein